MEKSFRALLDFLRPHILPLGALAAMAAVTYLAVYDPAVYMDDWDLFRKFIFGKMLLVDFNSRRPFEDAVIWLLFNIVGVNPRAMFLVIVGLIFSCAVVIYLLIRRIFPRLEFLALPVALLFIVYPVDYTKVWMTRVYQWTIYLFVLLGTFLLFEFLRDGRGWKLALALLLLLLPLGAYDGQLGLVALMPILLAVFTPGVPFKRRLLALSPLLGVVFLAAWRLFIQPVLLGFNDPYLGQASYTPLDMLRRILVGFPVFAESWIKPFEFILPGLSPLKLLFILAVAVAAVVLIGRAGFELQREKDDEAGDGLERHKDWRALGLLFGFGLAIWAAGLVPAVVLSVPGLNLNGSSTRAHTYAILGGSIWLICLLAFGAYLAAPKRRLVGPLLIIAVIPFLVVGLTQQIWIQNESRMAWRQQQVFWKTAFITLPDLKDGTTVLVAVRGNYPQRPFEHLPLTAEWEVNHGFKVLYDNPSLQGMLYFSDFTTGTRRETKLLSDGVHGYIIDSVPYDQLVIVSYNPANQVMQIVSDPEQEFDLPFTVVGYHPEQFILDSPPADSPYRALLH
jgi:hypothetical protein